MVSNTKIIQDFNADRFIDSHKLVATNERVAQVLAFATFIELVQSGLTVAQYNALTDLEWEAVKTSAITRAISFLDAAAIAALTANDKEVATNLGGNTVTRSFSMARPPSIELHSVGP